MKVHLSRSERDCAPCRAKRGIGASGRSPEMGVLPDAPTSETIGLPIFTSSSFMIRKEFRHQLFLIHRRLQGNLLHEILPPAPGRTGGRHHGSDKFLFLPVVKVLRGRSRNAEDRLRPYAKG